MEPCSSSHVANRSCSSARVALVSASYAASRMSRCRKRNPSSPEYTGAWGSISCLRTRFARRGVTRSASGSSACTAATMEDLSFDGGSFEHGPLAGLQLVESGGEQRLQRRRDDDLAVGRACHADHLVHEERVAAGGARDSLAELAGSPRGSSESTSPAVRRSSRIVTCQSGRRSTSSGRAMQRIRIGLSGREKRDVLDQVEEGLLAPLDVVEHDDERPLGGSMLERLAKRPRDLLGRHGCFVLTEERADRGGGPLVARPAIQLHQHLDHGPVRDSLAVRQAARGDDPCIDRRERLRGES